MKTANVVDVVDTSPRIGIHVCDRVNGRYLGVVSNTLASYSGADLPVFEVTCVDRRRRRFYGDELNPVDART